MNRKTFTAGKTWTPDYFKKSEPHCLHHPGCFHMSGFDTNMDYTKPGSKNWINNNVIHKYVRVSSSSISHTRLQSIQI